MKHLIESHTHTIYLKPGEVVVAREPVLVSTVLGSCVSVTMFSPGSGVGAICHAMLPENAGRDEDLRYVDTALRHIYRKVTGYGVGRDLVVKLFGGARVLNLGDSGSPGRTVGEQNVARALEILEVLGLKVNSADTGGVVGRKLYFCTRDGDVYLRRMRDRKNGELS
ncbi:MAG: chemotaxis protein CheD [Desulfuromonadaceae bacterium]